METIKIKEKKGKEIINKTVEILKKGNIVIYPTETCYGIGVDPTNQNAVEKLLKYKYQRKDKPISIAVNNKKMAEEYAIINKMAEDIIDNFLPGPITVVCKGRHKVAQGIESIQGTIGIRIPNYPLILKIIENFQKPITATSANASYKKTPYSIKDILDNISQKQKNLISLILDAGTLPKRKTSTVIDTTLETPKIIREGDIFIGKIESFISNKEEETFKFAEKIYKEIKNYIGNKLIIFELYGDLGSGKTYFTQCFGNILGIKEKIISPTFILCNEYTIEIKNRKITLYHIDVYRMYEEQEIEDIGGSKIFKEPNIILIEWANKVSNYIKKIIKEDYILIKIYFKHISLNKREITYQILKIKKKNN